MRKKGRGSRSCRARLPPNGVRQIPSTQLNINKIERELSRKENKNGYPSAGGSLPRSVKHYVDRRRPNSIHGSYESRESSSHRYRGSPSSGNRRLAWHVPNIWVWSGLSRGHTEQKCYHNLDSSAGNTGHEESVQGNVDVNPKDNATEYIQNQLSTQESSGRLVRCSRSLSEDRRKNLEIIRSPQSPRTHSCSPSSTCSFDDKSLLSLQSFSDGSLYKMARARAVVKNVNENAPRSSSRQSRQSGKKISGPRVIEVPLSVILSVKAGQNDLVKVSKHACRKTGSRRSRSDQCGCDCKKRSTSRTKKGKVGRPFVKASKSSRYRLTPKNRTPCSSPFTIRKLLSRISTWGRRRRNTSSHCKEICEKGGLEQPINETYSNSSFRGRRNEEVVFGAGSPCRESRSRSRHNQKRRSSYCDRSVTPYYQRRKSKPRNRKSSQSPEQSESFRRNRSRSSNPEAKSSRTPEKRPSEKVIKVYSTITEVSTDSEIDGHKRTRGEHEPRRKYRRHKGHRHKHRKRSTSSKKDKKEDACPSNRFTCAVM